MCLFTFISNIFFLIKCEKILVKARNICVYFYNCIVIRSLTLKIYTRKPCKISLFTIDSFINQVF